MAEEHAELARLVLLDGAGHLAIQHREGGAECHADVMAVLRAHGLAAVDRVRARGGLKRDLGQEHVQRGGCAAHVSLDGCAINSALARNCGLLACGGR